MIEEQLFDYSVKFHRGMTKYYCFADFETTGFCPIKNDWITGYFILTDLGYNIVNERLFRARPRQRETWGEGAENVHGISRDVAFGFPSRIDCLHDIVSFLEPLGKHVTRFIFHAKNNFDWNFLHYSFYCFDLDYELKKYVNNKNLESTIDLAKSAGHSSGKLNVLCDNYGIPLKHHDAKSDTEACLKLHKIFSDKGRII